MSVCKVCGIESHRREKMSNYDAWLQQVEERAASEGPDAVAELESLREHFRERDTCHAEYEKRIAELEAEVERLKAENERMK